MTEPNRDILKSGDAEMVADYLAGRAATACPSSATRHQVSQALRALSYAMVARRDDAQDSFMLTSGAVREQITLANMISARHAQTSTAQGRWALRTYLEHYCPGYDDTVGVDDQPADVGAAHAPVAEYVTAGLQSQAGGDHG